MWELNRYGRQKTDDGRRTTDDGRRTTDDGRWTTDDGRRTTDDGRRTTMTHFKSFQSIEGYEADSRNTLRGCSEHSTSHKEAFKASGRGNRPSKAERLNEV